MGDVCALCLAAPRTDRVCEDGWIEVPADSPIHPKTGLPIYGPMVARCKQWESRLKGQRLERMFARSGLDDAAYTKDFHELEVNHPSWRFARQSARNVREVLEKGLNFSFLGPAGTGKTHAAVLVSRAAVRAGFTALKVDWARFLAGLRASYNDKAQPTEAEQVAQLASVDLLVIDDVGAGRASGDFSVAKLEDVMRPRYDAGRPTIITANLSPEEFAAAVGDRALSRFRGRLVPLNFNGTVYRASVEGAQVSDLVQRLWRGAKGGRA